MKTLVIEVSGGVVQEVYTDAEELQVVMIDWDAGESPGDACEGGMFATATANVGCRDTLLFSAE